MRLLAQAVVGKVIVDAFGVCSAACFVKAYIGCGAAHGHHIFVNVQLHM